MINKKAIEVAITLRRDEKSPLKFKGELIGTATRLAVNENDDGVFTEEISARLFRTSGGKYVVGIECYDKTNEQYEDRFAETRVIKPEDYTQSSVRQYPED
jgi:hypothetical protein